MSDFSKFMTSLDRLVLAGLGWNGEAGDRPRGLQFPLDIVAKLNKEAGVVSWLLRHPV